MSRSEDIPPRLILASASPRRRELLGLLGLPYDIVPSRYEEPSALAEPVDIAAFVTYLATEKAREVALRSEAAWVLGADTEVVFEPFDRPMGKPADERDARRMLRALAGRTHIVCTGVALVEALGSGQIGVTTQIAVQTRVRFREMSDAMIADYVATGEPMDKAGAYGAQGYAAPFIEGFEGDFFNVVGLPICAVGRMLESVGVRWWHDRRDLPTVSG